MSHAYITFILHEIKFLYILFKLVHVKESFVSNILGAAFLDHANPMDCILMQTQPLTIGISESTCRVSLCPHFIDRHTEMQRIYSWPISCFVSLAINI